MSYYDDKPKKKNDDYVDRFSQSYPDYDRKENGRYEYENERGGCLTVFLVVQFIYSVVILIGGCNLLNAPTSRYGSSDELAFLGMFVICLAALRLIFLTGVWNWSSWGYYGLMVIYGLGAIGSLCSGNFMTVILLLVEVGIFYYLMQDKMDSLT
jgi:hypothetical protein